MKAGCVLIQEGGSWVIKDHALKIMEIDSQVVDRIKEVLNEASITDMVRYLKAKNENYQNHKR